MREDYAHKKYPNCFSAKLTNEDTDNINIVFAKAKIDKNGKISKEQKIEIISDFNINKEGLKVVLKRLLDLSEEYSKRYDVDILQEILDEYDEAGEK